MRCSERNTPRRHRAASGLVVFALALWICHAAAGDDLGVIGPVYAIAEASLLDLIHARLKALASNGGLARLEREATARIEREVSEPSAIKGVSKTSRPRSFHVDPSIEVPYPIKDADGRVLVAPGTRVNPLDTVTVTRPLLFIDARDPEQVARATALLDTHHGELKIVLTGGSYLELMRRLRRPIFFDQQGRLVSRLGIRQVPALVSQEGRQLRVDELL